MKYKKNVILQIWTGDDTYMEVLLLLWESVEATEYC